MNTVAARKLGHSAMAHVEAVDPAFLQAARKVGPNTFRNLRSKRFLEQYCWVVYVSGFRFKIIEETFPKLRVAFKEFDLPALSRMRSIKPVLRVFNNERKAKGFLAGAGMIAKEGFSSFKRRIKKEGPEALTKLPGIGAITKDHLAKNIGLADVPKADIWLERAAESVRAKSVAELVQFLAAELNETQHVVDIAIWQFGKDGMLK